MFQRCLLPPSSGSDLMMEAVSTSETYAVTLKLKFPFSEKWFMMQFYYIIPQTQSWQFSEL
jgi:hypothetical protein